MTQVTPGELSIIAAAIAANTSAPFNTVSARPIRGGSIHHAWLLHGDLWSGNAARCGDGTALIFDPACYHGDRETDIAMPSYSAAFPRNFLPLIAPPGPWTPATNRASRSTTCTTS